MNYWKEIYRQGDKIFRLIVAEALGETQEERKSPEGPDARIRQHLEDPVYLHDSLQRQAGYDPVKAYRYLKRRHRRRLTIRYGVAAAILLLLSFSGYLFVSRERPALPPEIYVKAGPIQPGAKKAVLTLADGAVWNIRDSSMNIETNSGKTLRIDSLGIVMPEETPGDTAVKMAYHTLYVPRGGEFSLTLPDHSRVWLNSESELRFPQQFSAHSREVELKGEAYFEVAENPGSPFRVKLDKGVITVYGTAFNVSNYRSDELAATLVSGKIGFTSAKGASVRLTPSQHLQYRATDDKISVKTVDTRLYTSWKDHLFCFEDQPLQKIMETLARWYDVEVSFASHELREKRLSGTLDKYDDIIPFLKLFEAGTEVRFEVNGRKIQVLKK